MKEQTVVRDAVVGALPFTARCRVQCVCGASRSLLTASLSAVRDPHSVCALC
jgi:hypothetical protein